MGETMKFSKAEKKRSKLRLGLTGPSGSGKTYSSLLIAAGMGGRVAVIEIGMKSEQREGAEYEFTTILNFSHESHFTSQIKDRTGLFANRDPFVIDIETGKALMDWLNSGAAEISLISVAQHRLLEFEIGQRGVDRRKVKDWCVETFGIAKYTELTTGQF